MGTLTYRVEQGAVRITHAGVEQIVRAGEQWSAPVDGLVAFENVGDDVARIVEADVLDATATSSLDANYASKFSDSQGGSEVFVINGATTFAGGTGRVVLERLTLPPGAVLAPYAQPSFAWVGIAAGRLGVTLEGERLPFRWDSGEERTYGLSQSLPVIAPATEVTLRNADDRPLVLYRRRSSPVALKDRQARRQHHKAGADLHGGRWRSRGSAVRRATYARLRRTCPEIRRPTDAPPPSTLQDGGPIAKRWRLEKHEDSGDA